MKIFRLLPNILLMTGLLEMQLGIAHAPAAFLSRHMPAVGVVLSPDFFRGFFIGLELVTLVCGFALFATQFASRSSTSAS